MSAGPRISVIIPTHNRVESLLRTISAFERQRFELQDMELIVVADGCTDTTTSTLERRTTPLDWKLVVLDGLGAGAARNAGAEAATGSLLLFMDDDIEPAPQLVEAHVRAHAESPGRVVMGPYPPSLRGRSAFFRMQARSWWQSHFYEMSKPGHRFTYIDLVSGNLSIGPEVFRKVGGFDGSIPGAGGEDYEFGVRIIEAGIEIHFEPGAAALHHEHETMTLDGSFRRARQEGRTNVAIGRKHPRLRRGLFWDMLESEEAPRPQLRYLVFRRPALGRILAAMARASLPVLELLKMRHRWRKAFGALFGYWRCRGVADELGSEAALSAYLERSPAASPSTGEDELVLDLAEGLDVAERLLDASRPRSVYLRYGEHDVGRIEPAAVAEPLKGAHLRPILAERFPWELLRVLALREAALVEPRSTHGPVI